MSKNIFEKLKEKGGSKPEQETPEEENVIENNEVDEERESLLAEASREELIDEINQAEQKVRENYDKALRLKAEIENLKRRSAQEVEKAHKYGLKEFANSLLPIVDSLELCAHSVPEEMKDATKSVVEGVELTLKMFYDVMEKFGIRQVDPVGEDFNPEYHQAIKTEESSELAPGKVISVMQKGYTLNDRLLRPALVIVSKAAE